MTLALLRKKEHHNVNVKMIPAKHAVFCKFAVPHSVLHCDLIHREVQTVCAYFQSRFYSLAKMTNLNWESEKARLVNMSREDRRKRFGKEDYITLDTIQSWRIYTIKHKSLEMKKPTLDDLTEFKKITLNQALNKQLLEKVAVYTGDITKLEVDAIVNAANSLLRKGGGVDGAIHRAAGPLLQQECNTLGGCPTGQAKITGGYDLPAKYVIHTVGPQDGSETKLQECYENCFACMEKHDLKSIAFPCISTGIYGFPNRLAAHIALKAARKFLEKHEQKREVERMEKIIFCTFLPIDVDIYETLLQMYFPSHEWNYNDGASVTE